MRTGDLTALAYSRVSSSPGDDCSNVYLFFLIGLPVKEKLNCVITTMMTSFLPADYLRGADGTEIPMDSPEK